MKRLQRAGGANKRHALENFRNKPFS